MSAISVVLVILTLVLYVGWIAIVSDMTGSDAAGNGLSKAFGTLVALPIFVLLAALVWMGTVKAHPPLWGNIAAVVLVPAWAAAALGAIDLLSSTYYKAKWPLVVPVVAPLLLLAYFAWCSVPAMRSAIPALVASGVVWGVMAVLAAVPWPEVYYRSHQGVADREKARAEWEAGAPQRAAEEERRRLAALEGMGESSPLRDWLEFTSGEGSAVKKRAFERIRGLARRQADAETMFRQGFTYLMVDLPELDLQATEPICEGSRKYLREKIAEFRPKIAEPPPYKNVSEFIEPYLPGLQWMVAHGCDCAAERKELEEAVKMYEPSVERNRFLEALQGLK